MAASLRSTSSESLLSLEAAPSQDSVAARKDGRFNSIRQRIKPLDSSQKSGERKFDIAWSVITNTYLAVYGIFNTLNFISSLSFIFACLLTLQEFLKFIGKGVLIGTGVIYLFTLARYIFLLCQQNAFMKQNKEYKGIIENLSRATNVTEQIQALEQALPKEPSARYFHTQEALKKLRRQFIKQDKNILKIEMIKAAVFKDNLTYLKNYDGNLTNRVTPWCVEKIKAEIEDLMRDLSSKDPVKVKEAVFETEELMSKVREESKKILIITIIGTICTVLMIAALASQVFGAPLAISIVLLILTFSTWSYEYTLLNGTAHHEGWNVHAIDLIPLWIRKLFSKAQKQVDETPPDELIFNGPDRSESNL